MLPEKKEDGGGLLNVKMRRLPPKSHKGKVRVIRVTKQGSQIITYERGGTVRGKKNIIKRLPPRKNKETGLASLSIK